MKGQTLYHVRGGATSPFFGDEVRSEVFLCGCAPFARQVRGSRGGVRLIPF